MTIAPPWLEPRTAYLHVPFCGHHCGYCDFAVTAGQDHLIELYLDALQLELATLGEPQRVESLFIGGGTPTYLNRRQLERLLTLIREWLPIIPNGEFSIESTPESWDPDKAKLLADYGVNRASIGVQSFHAHLLGSLDRRHGVSQIPHAVDVVRRHLPMVSFDLIFAAPGQTLAEWQADLHQALVYEPDHLSTYGLTYEKGTPLWKDRERGRVVSVNEHDELRMYEYAMEYVCSRGFDHYEISNFAKPNRRCVHNDRYWANEAYYGFGVGAARYVHGSRELNVRDTKLYIQRLLAGESPTFQVEKLDPHERAVETMAIQLRRCEGIARAAFVEQTTYELDRLVPSGIDELVELGLLIDDSTHVRLTQRGKCVADGVIEQLLRKSV
jgi:oxygen-independent coproporphyrinogen III oxidase